MHRRLPFFFLIIALALNLSSCATHDDPQVARELTTKAIDESFGYGPSSIKPFDKCEQPCEVNVVNAEQRTARYVYWNPGKTASYTPKKFAGTIVHYIGDELARRGVKLNSQSTKKIMISLGEAKFHSYAMGWYDRGIFELKVDIPAMNFHKSYWSEETNADLSKALAHAVHRSVRDLLKDPVVIKYIENKP